MFAEGIEAVKPFWHGVLAIEILSVVVLLLDAFLLFGGLPDLSLLVRLDVSLDLLDHLLAMPFSVREHWRCHAGTPWRQALVHAVALVGRVRVEAVDVHFSDAGPRFLLVSLLDNLEILLQA